MDQEEEEGTRETVLPAPNVIEGAMTAINKKNETAKICCKQQCECMVRRAAV